MTTFSWKRKIGENISKSISLKFSDESEIEISNDTKLVESYKRKKIVDEIQRKKKSDVHKNQGIELAEKNRSEEAIHEFDIALSLAPKDEKLLEMKAQTLLQMNQPFPAVQCAERAVKLNPRWWVAYQTLGRCQLGIGDLKLAKISFSKAIHINPIEKELWEEDLKWTLHLIAEEDKLHLEKEAERENTKNDLNNVEETNVPKKNNFLFM